MRKYFILFLLLSARLAYAGGAGAGTNKPANEFVFTNTVTFGLVNFTEPISFSVSELIFDVYGESLRLVATNVLGTMEFQYEDSLAGAMYRLYDSRNLPAPNGPSVTNIPSSWLCGTNMFLGTINTNATSTNYFWYIVVGTNKYGHVLPVSP